MVLSESEIASLLEQRAITNEWPWNTGDEGIVHDHLKDVVAELRTTHRLLDKTEFNHYGSGYASFVDCWLYRAEDDFRCGDGDSYVGLVVLFSILSRHYAIGQGQRTWDERSSSSYLPSFEFVDELTHPTVAGLAVDVCASLDARGLTRVYKGELSARLPDPTHVPTLLGDPPFRHFDALFY